MPDPAGNPLDPSRIAAQVAPAAHAEAGAIDMLQLMITRADEVDKLGGLFAVCAEWYRKNIDIDAFKAGGDLGPPEPAPEPAPEP